MEEVLKVETRVSQTRWRKRDRPGTISGTQELHVFWPEEPRTKFSSSAIAVPALGAGLCDGPEMLGQSF